MEYAEWKPVVKYSNFMELTSPVQRNPFGVAGYPPAMEKLELQGPKRPSTETNPFANVPMLDYDTRQRYSKAEPNPDSRPNFYKKLIQSPEDAIFERQSSERQFYTTNNSSVPNEQTKFAEWLYGKNFVCKSSSIYMNQGYPYTSESLTCTGQNASEPENAGQVENNYGTVPFDGAFWTNNPNYGYGFGGIPGGVPNTNVPRASPNYQVNPMPLAGLGP